MKVLIPFYAFLVPVTVAHAQQNSGISDELVSEKPLFENDNKLIKLTPRDGTIIVSKVTRERGEPAETQDLAYRSNECLVPNQATGDETMDVPKRINLGGSIAKNCVLEFGGMPERNAPSRYRLICTVPNGQVYKVYMIPSGNKAQPARIGAFDESPELKECPGIEKRPQRPSSIDTKHGNSRVVK